MRFGELPTHELTQNGRSVSVLEGALKRVGHSQDRVVHEHFDVLS
jgi:hypothetical protein